MQLRFPQTNRKKNSFPVCFLRITHCGWKRFICANTCSTTQIRSSLINIHFVTSVTNIPNFPGTPFRMAGPGIKFLAIRVQNQKEINGNVCSVTVILGYYIPTVCRARQYLRSFEQLMRSS